MLNKKDTDLYNIATTLTPQAFEKWGGLKAVLNVSFAPRGRLGALAQRLFSALKAIAVSTSPWRGCRLVRQERVEYYNPLCHFVTSPPREIDTKLLLLTQERKQTVILNAVKNPENNKLDPSDKVLRMTVKTPSPREKVGMRVLQDKELLTPHLTSPWERKQQLPLQGGGCLQGRRGFNKTSIEPPPAFVGLTMFVNNCSLLLKEGLLREQERRLHA